MKVILNDSGPARDSKKEKPDKSESRRKTPRSGGFRRNKATRANDIDELLASGADGGEPAAPEVEPPEVEPPEVAGDLTSTPQPKRGSSRRTSGMARKGGAPRMSRKTQPLDTEEDEGEPVQDVPEPEANVEADADAATEREPEEVAPRRRGMRSPGASGRPATGGSSVKITVNDEPPKGRSRTPKKERPPKEEKPLKIPKQRGEPKPPKEPRQKREKEPKPPRASRRKAAAVVDEDFDEAFTPNQPEVIVVPESIGMQLLTVVEAVAGAAIVFFGATQVGNILITKIMSGMLGG